MACTPTPSGREYVPVADYRTGQFTLIPKPPGADRFEGQTLHLARDREARMLAKWCVAKRWLRASPLEGVEGRGKRRHGKPQLLINEARRLMARRSSSRTPGRLVPLRR